MKDVKTQKLFEQMKGQWGYANIFQMPRCMKLVVSTGVGSLKDKKKLELIADRLAKLSGQKPAARGARMSIASFKLRQGDVVGYQVTLRGERMRGFLEKLLRIALPRTRDFRGIPLSSVDSRGNLTIGIREHTVFPETSDEDLKDVFGLAVTITLRARTRDEAIAYYKAIGVPFRRLEEVKEGTTRRKRVRVKKEPVAV